MAYDVYRLWSGVYSVSGSDWTDSELPLVEWHDSGSGTYTTSAYTVTACYGALLRSFVGQGATLPIWLQPNSNLNYQAPCILYGCCINSTNKIRIESLDGTRWADLYIDNSGTRDGYYNDSEGQAHTVDAGYPNYTGRYPLCRLTVNTDGRVAYYAGFDTQYDTSCSSSWTTVLSGTTTNPVFNVDEELIFKYFSYTTGTFYIYQFGFDLTLTPTSGQLAWISSELDFPTCTMGATQDNSASPYGTLFHDYYTGLQADWDKWDAHFELAPASTRIWYATYMRVFTAGSLWNAKAVFGLSNEYLDFWFEFGYLTPAILLVSEDNNRWIKVARGTSSPYPMLITSSGVYSFDSSPDAMSYGTDRFVRFLITGGNIYVSFEQVGYDNAIYSGAIPFTDIFNSNDLVYIAFQANYYSYDHFTRRQAITSPDLPPEGQNMIKFNMVTPDPLDMTDLITQEYMCYFKTKIRNSQDYNDPTSLFAMDPGHPSDAEVPLKEGDTCIVFEKYNRVYYYILRAGDMTTNLPFIIRMTSTLYWELVDATPDSQNIVCEQYNVIGLADGNDVIITHTKHDTGRSYVPAIQLLHNNRVKTEGIIASRISDTQIRLSTAQVTAFENLKINVYVNP